MTIPIRRVVDIEDHLTNFVRKNEQNPILVEKEISNAFEQTLARKEIFQYLIGDKQDFEKAIKIFSAPQKQIKLIGFLLEDENLFRIILSLQDLQFFANSLNKEGKEILFNKTLRDPNTSSYYVNPFENLEKIYRLFPNLKEEIINNLRKGKIITCQTISDNDGKFSTCVSEIVKNKNICDHVFNNEQLLAWIASSVERMQNICEAVPEKQKIKLLTNLFKHKFMSHLVNNSVKNLARHFPDFTFNLILAVPKLFSFFVRNIEDLKKISELYPKHKYTFYKQTLGDPKRFFFYLDLSQDIETAQTIFPNFLAFGKKTRKEVFEALKSEKEAAAIRKVAEL